MQSKGFIRVIAILLVLVCAFYLSFSYVTRHFEEKAAAYAQENTKTNDESSVAYKVAYKHYIDSIAKKEVYLNYYTFAQVREMAIGLGLDLKGGMNVTLQISVPDILKSLSNNNPDPKFNKAIAITDSLVKKGQVKDFVAAFSVEYKKLAPEGNLAQIFRSVEKVKTGASNAEVESILKEELNGMVDNSFKVLRTRIDGFGVVAPNIQKLERDGQILLELPGVKEPERVRKLLQGTANLEFYETYLVNDIAGELGELSQAVLAENAPVDTAKAVNPTDSLAVAQNDTTKAAVAKDAPTTMGSDAQKFSKFLAGANGPVLGVATAQDTAAITRIFESQLAKRVLPNNLKPRWTIKGVVTDNEYFQLVALKATNGKPRLSGDAIEDATSEIDQMQGNVVSMVMTNEAAGKWATITSSNIGKSIAIVLDDKVYSFPTVKTTIEGGRSQITGDFSPEEAKDLANVLKSGKMAAKVNIIGESVIGPSLGQQAIENGLWSFVFALILLMIFMIAMYGFAPGLIANLGLLCNLFFTFGILSSIQAVLTLSGIAGIVLTMGMAVDANVLIFERAKEELRSGKNLKAALSDGYKNAFSAIFDSNLTSIITGVILLYYGTGPIKGFATTLIIGIICSFFTAVFVTRLIFEGILNKGGLKNMTFTTALSRNLWTNTKLNFLGKRKMFFGIAAAIIIAATASFAIRQLSLGIDFSGGRNYIVQFDHSVKTHEIKQTLDSLFPNSTVSVITIDDDTKVRISTNYKIESSADGIDEEIMGILYKGLKAELGTMSYEDFSVSNETIGVMSTEKVGPAIASDITTGAIWAVVFSMIAMFLYILLRFRNVSFSLGAITAVGFTAYTVIGVYSMFYGILPFALEIDQTFIAAILTVIGYQVNDTVVVFDRVRENRNLYPKQDIFETFNISLNSTLTRTIMTSFSTFLVLLSIFILGGEVIRSFTFAMLIGVFVGTLASIFIASPVAFLVQRASDAKKKKA